MGKYLLFLPFLLLLLRPIEVACTPDSWEQPWIQIDKQQGQISGTQGKTATENAERREEAMRQVGVGGFVGLGVLRALDDASFWTALACVIASLRLLALRTTPPANAGNDLLWRVTLVMVFCAGTGLYLHRMVQTGGTVWWPVAHWPPDGWRFFARSAIQVIEGFVKIGAFAALCYACKYGMEVCKALAVSTPFPTQAASELLSACLCTFPLVFFVFVVFKLVTSDIGFTAESTLLFGIKLVSQLAVASVPLWLLAVLAVRRWGPGRSYQLKIAKELVAVEVS